MTAALNVSPAPEPDFTVVNLVVAIWPQMVTITISYEELHNMEYIIPGSILLNGEFFYASDADKKNQFNNTV